jgi:hypothetical protein
MMPADAFRSEKGCRTLRTSLAAVHQVVANHVESGALVHVLGCAARLGDAPVTVMTIVQESVRIGHG